MYRIPSNYGTRCQGVQKLEIQNVNFLSTNGYAFVRILWLFSLKTMFKLQFVSEKTRIIISK